MTQVNNFNLNQQLSNFFNNILIRSSSRFDSTISRIPEEWKNVGLPFGKRLVISPFLNNSFKDFMIGTIFRKEPTKIVIHFDENLGTVINQKNLNDLKFDGYHEFDTSNQEFLIELSSITQNFILHLKEIMKQIKF